MGQLADFDGALTVIGAGKVLKTAHSIPELVRLALVFGGGIMGGFPDLEVRLIFHGVAVGVNGGAIANSIV